MIVTLLTDFGTRDYYVAAMKGVLLSESPRIQVVDLSHEIPPGDVEGAAFVLEHAVETFPDGTVHCAVVDPGVGTDRAALVASDGRHLFVAPDNGLLTWVVERGGRFWKIETIGPPRDAPRTFHGRDWFAPVAAKLASGMSPDEVGPEVQSPVTLDLARPEKRADGSVLGRVIWIDRFGNLVTNVPGSWLEPTRRWMAVVGGREVPVYETFGDVEPGEPVSYRGSAGLMEVGLRSGDASSWFCVNRGCVATFVPR